MTQKYINIHLLRNTIGNPSNIYVILFDFDKDHFFAQYSDPCSTNITIISVIERCTVGYTDIDYEGLFA